LIDRRSRRTLKKNPGGASVSDQNKGPFQLSEVLRTEFKAIVDSGDDGAAAVAGLRGIFEERFQNHPLTETERRSAVYNAAHRLQLSAVCLSGGGIRSASFSLGAMQGLAEAELLDKFKYLSTVSGGGYIGSWLSAWLHWNARRGGNSKNVLKALHPRRDAADEEPPPIRHLRQYSSYLTPKIGLMSGDFWAALAIILRNLILNWLVLVPLIAFPVILLKLVAALLQTSQFMAGWFAFLFAFACIGFSGWSLYYKISRLYIIRPVITQAEEQPAFLRYGLWTAGLAGLCFTWLADFLFRGASLHEWHLADSWNVLVAIILIALIVYWIVAATIDYKTRTQLEQSRFKKQDCLAWAVATIAWGILIWLGLYIYSKLSIHGIHVHETSCGPSCEDPIPLIDHHQLLVIFGLPWFLFSTALAQSIYALANSYSPAGDFQREWLGRAGGWYLVAGLGWMTLSAIVLFAPHLFWGVDRIVAGGHKWLTTIGAASGALSAFLGSSSLTSAQGASTGWRSTMSSIALMVAGPVFAFVLLILLSVAFDAIALGEPFQNTALFKGNDSGPFYWLNWIWSLATLLVLAAIMLVSDYFMNVNRFSLHAVYRNRLVRAYLGGPRTYPGAAPGSLRKPDGFTGFDQNDNLRLTKLWPNNPRQRGGWRPFHVINMTLNLPATRNLAWQQRKAISFTATPLFCGAAEPGFGYRNTRQYGDPGRGISLGTAMAISGAAASSNMGYHSSPSAAFLLTLFNVRLGWWLGNPGPAGNNERPFLQRINRWLGPNRDSTPYAQDAPPLSLAPLLNELFGMMNESDRYVYLSDGGHFEDLGIYEMVRRRCKWIVAIDGDADPQRGFIDLGDAVRKVWIDLGVRITFEKADLLQATRETKPENVPYFALGTIEYVSDARIDGKVPRGHILYIKPTVRGDEWAADIIAYQRANPDFPHQATGDQWFDEPQLEAYRALGYLVMSRILRSLRAVHGESPATLPEFFDRVAEVSPKTFA
jgi:hypothetical protein